MTLTPRMKENSRLPKEHTVCSSQNHIRLTLDLSFLARVPSQSCPTTLYNSMDPPGSSLHGIRQARILEWVAISFSRASSQPGDQTSISYGFCVGRQCFTTVLSGLGSPISFTASKNFDKLVSFIKIFLYFSLDLYFDPSMC